MRDIVAKIRGSRTRAANSLLKRVHNEICNLEPCNQLAVLRTYAPVLQPLLPVGSKFFDEHSITKVGVLDGVKAKAIARLADASAARV